MYYCGCNIVLHSVVAISDEGEVPLISDSSSWASLYRPVEPAIVDPNQAPTEVALLPLLWKKGDTFSPCNSTLGTRTRSVTSWK